MDRASNPQGDTASRPPARGNGPALAAAALGAAYLLAAAVVPAAFPLVTVAAAGGGCALVLTRRRGRALRLVLAAVPIWLAVGLGGALLLRNRPFGGLTWVALALFLAPLPVVPWLYARTFGAPKTGPLPPTPERRDRP